MFLRSHVPSWRPRHRLAIAGLLALASIVPAAASAQSAPAPAPAPATPAATPSAAAPAPLPVAGWQNGFFLQSPNGDNRITIGTVIQVDGKFTTDEPSAFTDTFTIRKARVALGGRIAKFFDFKLTPELGNGAATVVDASFDTRFSNAFRIRVGKDKTPVGLELLYSDPGLLFPERSLASTLVPNRDIGVQALGDVAGQKLTYSFGVFNGIVDGSSSTADVDTNNGKDVAGRVVLQPFRRATNPGALNNFGIHLGGSHGSQTGALPSFKTSAGQTYFSYTGANADGERWRVSPAAFYYHSVFGVFAEYAKTEQRITKGAVTRTIANDGWDVSAAINLTGETATNGVVPPKRVFDPSKGTWGALQLVLRYSALTIDQAAFDAGFNAANTSREAKQFTVGVNWYPVQFIKYYLNYERTTFEGGVSTRPAENTIIFRGQLAF